MSFPSERELLRPPCVDQGVDDRLEQALRGPGVLGRTADQPCSHDWLITDEDERPPADLELALEAFVEQGQGPCDGDGVVAFAGVRRYCEGVSGDDPCVADAQGGEVAL